MRIIHPTIIDTVLLYPHSRGLPLRNGLRNLMRQHLNRDIQVDGAGGTKGGHDSAGQELTGLRQVARTLLDGLREHKSPEAPLAHKLVEGLQRVLSQIRAISRNLIPVEVDSQGLTSSLADLAGRISELHGITCTFDQSRSVSLDDHQTATQLFRIAQEAIANAIRHGEARKIIISLGQEQGRTTLQIRDDGVGIPSQKPATAGIGLPIMQYRARLINANFSVAPAPNRGTLVTCTVSHPGGAP